MGLLLKLINNLRIVASLDYRSMPQVGPGRFGKCRGTNGFGSRGPVFDISPRDGSSRVRGEVLAGAGEHPDPTRPARHVTRRDP